MTQSTQQNPWEQAAAQYGQPAQQPTQQAQSAAYQQQHPVQGQQQASQQGGGSSALAGAYAPAPTTSFAQSRLFDQEQAAPSLFNKTHFLGTERTGIITGPPRDVQDKDYDSRLPKYWSKSKVGKPTPAITTDPIDGPTGEPNDKVMSIHFDLQTDYRMTEQECYAVNRDPAFVREDDGRRVEVISGRDIKAFRKAMDEFTASGGKLAGPEDFVGKRITSKRAGQVPAGANKAWVREFTISNA